MEEFLIILSRFIANSSQTKNSTSFGGDAGIRTRVFKWSLNTSTMIVNFFYLKQLAIKLTKH